MNESQTLPERRPIKSRELTSSKAIARWFVRAGVRPNAVSITGMISGVLAGGAFAWTAFDPGHARWFWLAAAIFIQLRLLANMFDGMIAIETGTDSPVGELYNEVPDRVSDAATLIGLGYAAASSPTFGFGAACVALFVAYVRAEGKVAGAPQDFCGPMAKQQRMFVATLVAFLSAGTPVAWQFIGPHHISIWALGLIIAGGLWTAMRRLQRSARALRQAK